MISERILGLPDGACDWHQACSLAPRRRRPCGCINIRIGAHADGGRGSVGRIQTALYNMAPAASRCPARPVCFSADTPGEIQPAAGEPPGAASGAVVWRARDGGRAVRRPSPSHRPTEHRRRHIRGRVIPASVAHDLSRTGEGSGRRRFSRRQRGNSGATARLMCAAPRQRCWRGSSSRRRHGRLVESSAAAAASADSRHRDMASPGGRAWEAGGGQPGRAVPYVASRLVQIRGREQMTSTHRHPSGTLPCAAEHAVSEWAAPGGQAQTRPHPQRSPSGCVKAGCPQTTCSGARVWKPPRPRPAIGRACACILVLAYTAE